MANFFTGLGQALPQAVGLMTNIQELQERSRHAREIEGMEKQRLGMEQARLDSTLATAVKHNNLLDEQIKAAQDVNKKNNAFVPVESIAPQLASFPELSEQFLTAAKESGYEVKNIGGKLFAQGGAINHIQNLMKTNMEFGGMALQNTKIGLQNQMLNVDKQLQEFADKPDSKDYQRLSQQKLAIQKQMASVLDADFEFQKQLQLQKAKETASMTEPDYLALPDNDPRKINLISGKGKLEEQKQKPGKAIERTVDLGDKVEYHYTDGRVETKPKGKIPSEKEPNIWEKKWALSIKALKDEDKVDSPSITQISEKYKKLYGQEDFLMGILQSMGINGNNPLGIVKK